MVADMKQPNVCGGQITRDTYQNLKGDWGFQTISKTWVPLKRLTGLTRLSSWAVCVVIGPGCCTHTYTMAGHTADKQATSVVSVDLHSRTRLNKHTQRHTTSRALLTFSHVPFLVRVPAYGSSERPRGKTEQKKPCTGKCHPRSMDCRHTHTPPHTQLNLVYKYGGKAGSGRVEKAQWKTSQSLA